jgi:hypothetical protein
VYVLFVVVTEVYVVFMVVVNVEVTVVLVEDVTVVVTIAVVVCAWSTDSVEEISRAEARPTKTRSRQRASNLLLAKLHIQTCCPVGIWNVVHCRQEL